MKEKKPILNQQCESLGTSADGCRCQIALNVTVKGGVIIDYEPYEETKFDTPAEKWWGKDRVYEKDGKLFLKAKPDDISFLWESSKEDPQEDTEIPIARKTESGWIIEESCPCMEEADTCIDEFEDKELADGEYTMVLEMAHYTSYSYMDGFEPEMDYCFGAIKRVGDCADFT